ncbi:hypothetical protein CC86DRAFT_375920 [Ophiobolus disseminans]|uniref:Uncharacterized protein n=1 Tax=Ophiobolus disseminans TaxID=1469910 RepID=A0A6A6ZDH4_9PLEO|nr:hypothetical protein CC86DRAFT_375920 [Ophiobolus disseminans]
MQAPSSPVNEPAAEYSPPSSNRQEKKRKHILERNDRKRRRVRVEGRRLSCTAHPACTQAREQKALREWPRGERAGANTGVGRATVLFRPVSDER